MPVAKSGHDVSLPLLHRHLRVFMPNSDRSRSSRRLALALAGAAWLGGPLAVVAQTPVKPAVPNAGSVPVAAPELARALTGFSGMVW